MKILTTLTAALLLSPLAISAAGAEGDPTKNQDDAAMPSAQATFKALDRNSDQRLSKTEAAADDNVSSQFAALDANADGYINKGEYVRSTRTPAPSEPLPTPDEE